MFEGIRALFCKWTPWEAKLLEALTTTLGEKHKRILLEQLQAVHKVQRILGWSEIDLYAKNGWDGVAKFFDDREFTLARASTFVGDKRIQSELFCVSGHLFSIESKAPIKPFAFRQDVRVEVFDVDRRFI
jgi:hypothetical protein